VQGYFDGKRRVFVQQVIAIVSAHDDRPCSGVNLPDFLQTVQTVIVAGNCQVEDDTAEGGSRLPRIMIFFDGRTAARVVTGE
jgi:hypothetical protein